MKYLENEQKVHLMIWEVYPRKRKKNNKISFLAAKGVDVNLGDVIFVAPTDNTASAYELTELLSERSAALKNHIYYEARVNWGRVSVFNILKNKSSVLSLRTEKFIKKLSA